jgi:hypothetical protein
MDESCALSVEVLLNARGVLLKKSLTQSWPHSSFRSIDQTRHLFSRATEGLSHRSAELSSVVNVARGVLCDGSCFKYNSASKQN